MNGLYVMLAAFAIFAVVLLWALLPHLQRVLEGIERVGAL